MIKRLKLNRQVESMRNKGVLQYVTGVCIAFLVGGHAHAAEYFVDGASSASGDGRSWSTAWRSFDRIDWQAIRPGDTLSVSGGTGGRVYRETLTVDASGTGSQPIVIRAAETSGHDGKVIIDAENSRDYGIVVDSVNHVRVTGFTVRNVGDAGVRVRWSSAGVVVEKMTVDAGNPNGDYNARGYDVRNSSGVVIRDNAYTTLTSSTAQNDAIWSSNNDGVRFENNRLVISNSFSGANEGHNDCLQSYLDKNIDVIGNYCEQRNTKTGHSQGIFIQDISGTARVRNNVVVSPNTNSACISIENTSGSTSGRMLAYNNSAYGCAYGTMHIVRSPGSVALNNILVSPKPNSQAMKVVPPAPPAANVDYNLLFAPASSRPAYLDGSGVQTWEQWRARGYERHGLYGDPRFSDPGSGDLSLRSDSVAIDAGMTISEVTSDTRGTSRPQAAAYDMGAYEHGGTGTSQTASQAPAAEAPAAEAPAAEAPNVVAETDTKTNCWGWRSRSSRCGSSMFRLSR